MKTFETFGTYIVSPVTLAMEVNGLMRAITPHKLGLKRAEEASENRK